MRSFRKELWFETPGRRAFINITPQVEAALKESDVQEGIALINAGGCTLTTKLSWKGWHRMSQFQATVTT